MKMVRPDLSEMRSHGAWRRAVSFSSAVSIALALASAAAPSPALAVAVTRGPYLQIGTPNSIVVRWRSDLASDSRVRYGTAIGSLGSTQDDLALSTEHEVKIVGLAPQTRYFYSIGTTTQILEGDDVDHSFVTFPPAGTPRPTRLWVIGDPGTGTSEQAAVRDAYAAYNGSRYTDLWLMLGDNAYSSGTDAEYQSAVFNMYSGLLKKTVLWPARGNHDGVAAGTGNDYYDFFSLPMGAEAGGLSSGTEAYYSYDYGNIHMICLDSEGSDRAPAGAMLTWLANDLAATNKDWVIAYWHHPPYTKGSHDSDNATDSSGKMRDMRQNALPILEAGGVDLVLTGHSHSYERSCLLDGHYGLSTTLTAAMKIDPGDGRVGGNGAYHKPAGQATHAGAVYTVAGSSGHTGGGSLNHPVMISSLNELGSLVIDIDGTRLDARFLNQLGAVRDSFTVIKAPRAGLGKGGPDDHLSILPGRPNPFAAESRIGYKLPSPGPVRLSVLDVNGRRVRTLVSGDRHQGLNLAVWDARDDRGQRVGAGVYFVMLEFESRSWARRLVLEP